MEPEQLQQQQMVLERLQMNQYEAETRRKMVEFCRCQYEADQAANARQAERVAAQIASFSPEEVEAAQRDHQLFQEGRRLPVAVPPPRKSKEQIKKEIQDERHSVWHGAHSCGFLRKEVEFKAFPNAQPERAKAKFSKWLQGIPKDGHPTDIAIRNAIRLLLAAHVP
jgi:hypothetical protein